MASAPTPLWVKLFIGVVVALIVTAAVLHLTGVMPRLHHMS